MNSKDERAPFKRPYSKYSYERSNKNNSKTHAMKLGVIIVVEVVTPHLIAALGKLKFLRG